MLQMMLSRMAKINQSILKLCLKAIGNIESIYYYRETIIRKINPVSAVIPIKEVKGCLALGWHIRNPN